MIVKGNVSFCITKDVRVTFLDSNLDPKDELIRRVINGSVKIIKE